MHSKIGQFINMTIYYGTFFMTTVQQASIMGSWQIVHRTKHVVDRKGVAWARVAQGNSNSFEINEIVLISQMRWNVISEESNFDKKNQ